MLFQSQINDFLRRLPWWQHKQEKQELRGLLEEKRRVLTTEQVAEYSEAILDNLIAMPEFERANTILAYYPIKNEVDVRPLLEFYHEKKVLLLPVVKKGHRMELRKYEGHDNLRRGRYGIPEPQGEEFAGKVDLIIVPGVGFDLQHHRIGRGGGYYDRFLKDRRGLKVALAYDFQIVDRIPVNFHDRKVDIIITPRQVIREKL